MHRPTRISCFVLWILAVCLTRGTAVQAQQDPAEWLVIADQVACSSCAVSIDTVAELGASDDDGIVISRLVAVGALADGRWVAFEPSDPGALKFYDPVGRFQQRLDAKGQGPGEYTGVHRILRAKEGHYWIYDISQARMNLVDEQFRYLDSNRFGIEALRIVPLAMGEFVVNAITAQGAANGDLIHVVDQFGTSRLSIGGNGRPLDFRRGRHVRHKILAVRHGGEIWAAPMHRYELTAYSPESGSVIHRIRRDAPWFRPHDDTSTRMDLRSGPPNPKIREMATDEEGRIWVVTWVADQEWERAVETMTDPAGGPDRNGLYDSVVEVLDPEQGRLLARARLPDALGLVDMGSSDSPGPVFYSAVQEATGYISVRILRASLRQ